MSAAPAPPVSRVGIRVQLPDGREVEAGELGLDQLGASRIPTPTFRYLPAYLSTRGAYPLSPDLPLSEGPLRPAQGRTTLGAFSDAMPDDWGKRVMRAGGLRVESDLDFLAHVRDHHRQGAIRVTIEGVPVSAESSPDLTTNDALVRWMAAALAFDAGTETDAQLEDLVRAGTSAGGARPKVVIDHGEGLRIVKFPRATELDNHMAWEGMALELARRAGAEVPAFWVPRLGDKLGLMTERFDRRPGGRRIGYLSAHSLTQRRDQDLSSYADLLEDLAEHGSSPRRDAEELFRRIAISILLNNVDDHWRNHGFLRDPQGWRLAPLFDVEPQREVGRTAATPLTASSSGVDRDIRELFDLHELFELTRERAAEIVRSVEAATRDWADVAVGFGIHPEQIPVWRRAFDGANRDRAREIADSA